MNLHRLILRTFPVLLLLFVESEAAQFNYIETEHVRLIYIGGAPSYLVPHAARCFENALAFHKRLWNYTPSEKPSLVLHDFGDYGNAGASTIPVNRVSVAIAPFSFAYETAPANERMNAIMNHEIVHLVAGDKSSASDRFFRAAFFGKVLATADNPLSIIYSYLTSPRRSAPVWYHEGIAVFMETWMAGGLGRSLGSWDEMVFRTMVRDSSRFYDVVGIESEAVKVDFQAGVNSYLYGTRFFSYIALQYGPESVLQWVGRESGSKSYFASQFKKVFGLSLDDAWAQWVQWEHDFQKTNLEAIGLYPTTPYRPLSKRPLGSVSRAFYDSSSGKLYAAVFYPGRPAHIAAIDIETGEMDQLCDVKGAAIFFVSSLAYDEKTGSLFYTTDNNDWRDLRVINVNTHKSKTLMKDARVGDLAFNRTDSSLWGVRHFNGISTLVRIPPPYDRWNQVYSWPYGRDVYDLDLSPDGSRMCMSLSEISGRQRLISMETEQLLAGDTTYTMIFDFQNSLPANFVFNDDGRYLYGSSYYTGASNIFRYDFARDSMEAISNCETGFFRPIPLQNDSLIVLRYTGDGFLPVMIADSVIEDISAIKYLGQEVVRKHPIVKDWILGSPADIDLDTLITDTGEYNSMANMRFSSLYPIVEGYKDEIAVGMRFNLAEPLGIRRASVTASFTPDDSLPDEERFHLDASYSYLDWRLSAKYNGGDFYDLFGPTKSSRKGYSLGIRYRKSLIHDPPKGMGYSINATWFGNLKRLPEYQNITASFDRFLSVSARLNYSHQRASIGAVDFERGWRWQVASKTMFVNKKVFPRINADLDFGIPLPIYHSSFWLRNSVGYAYGDRIEPFANFYFGGFGNNWVDHQSVKRYRRYVSFPGVELNEIGGTNFTKVTAEWNLPPLRFRRLGVSSFYLTWIRMALFTSAIATNVHKDEFRRELATAGAQMDFRMTLLSHLRMTLSLGYAVAFEQGRNDVDEYMVSLKVL